MLLARLSIKSGHCPLGISIVAIAETHMAAPHLASELLDPKAINVPNFKSFLKGSLIYSQTFTR
jgi:hypothetical protein